eukprot:4781607-Pleurochrysis_carterae.AAC.1
MPDTKTTAVHGTALRPGHASHCRCRFRSCGAGFERFSRRESSPSDFSQPRTVPRRCCTNQKTVGSFRRELEHSARGVDTARRQSSPIPSIRAISKFWASSVRGHLSS